MKKDIITIGTDFELPLFRNGKGVSAIGIIGGTKENPIPIGKGCSKQEDNVMAEFCIPPATNFSDFITSIDYCLKVGNEIAGEYGACLQAVSSLIYPDEELKDPLAQEIGCSSSICPYTGEESKRPDKFYGNLRTAGFHIHIGWEEIAAVPGQSRIGKVERLMKLMDKYVGVPSLLIDDDNVRRELYGNPGDYRLKKYGAEYRVLGAGVMTFQGLEEVWENTFKAIEAYKKGETINDDTYRDIIRNNDKEAARVCVGLWELEEESI